MESTRIVDGLAIYEMGAGEPLLLMPYPHGYTRTKTADGGLFEILAGFGRRVITFDPPGAYNSTREPQVSMPEMLACAEEVIKNAGITGPVDIVGHSMGGLVSLGLAIERPELVKRMVIIDSLTGGPAVRRHRAMPYSWGYLSPSMWSFVRHGGRISRGKGNLRDHKILQRLVMNASYRDPSYLASHLADIGPDYEDDRLQPPPARDIWPIKILRLDYRDRLGEVRAQTLVITGHYDPQVPESAAKEIADGIPGAVLSVFKNSAHYPYIEEPEKFRSEVSGFLR
jgi:pimeloyl-ACP methyl ester carboxylesterase